jgi:hypothetical protein
MTYYDDPDLDSEAAAMSGAHAAGAGDAPRGRAASPSSPYSPPESEALLRRVAEIIAGARPMPLSASVMINKEEVLELLEEAIARLPDELRAARWLLKERDEFLAKVRREGDDILDQARARAERMVQRTEVVKAADQRARQIVERARDEARKLRLEAEDFVDQKLASFEIVLARTLKMVGAGRAKLQGQPVDTGDNPVVDVGSGDPTAGDDRSQQPFFDQDRG